jgi:hypothetical protein
MTVSDRARGDLGDDLALGLGGKTQSAMLLADEHAEKALVLEELPDLGGQVHAVVARVPIIDHRADLFAGAVHEGLFFRREVGLADGKELVPIRRARKNLGVPAHGASIERFLLGARNARQDGFDHSIGRAGQDQLPDGRKTEQPEDDRGQQRDDPAAGAGGKRQPVFGAQHGEDADHRRSDGPLPEG